MKQKKFTCLVCGFNGLDENLIYQGKYQKTFEICSCCGFEFGFSEDHDARLGYIVTPDDLIEAAFQLYRKQWIDGGIKIAHPEDVPNEMKKGEYLKPEVLVDQLQRVGLDLSNFDVENPDFEKHIR